MRSCQCRLIALALLVALTGGLHTAAHAEDVVRLAPAEPALASGDAPVTLGGLPPDGWLLLVWEPIARLPLAPALAVRRAAPARRPPRAAALAAASTRAAPPLARRLRAPGLLRAGGSADDPPTRSVATV